MSAADGSEPGEPGDGPDPKANEEERYRLKIAVLQEYYDAVALQTVRIRERIYQVKKQCRRLEAMKRVALNMLHQNTGTYEIPPLEIIDEDPAPSFLESVHRQQHTPPETPRKKSKRPSRSKSDGKLTAEEEERAKQKICSIIDSVYSETAKRLGDTPKRPMRSVNAVGSSGQCGNLKRPRRLFSAEIKSEEGSNKDGGTSASAQHANDDGCQASGSSTLFNGHPEAYMEETESETSSMIPYSEANTDSSIDLTYDSLPLEHHMRYDPVEGTTQSIVYHNMTTALYDGAVAYSDSADRARSYDMNLVNTVYDSSLVTVQPLDYTDEKVTVRSTSYMDSIVLPINQALPRGTGESSAIYTNAATYANTSVTMSYNENLNPAAVLDYPEEISVMPVTFSALTPATLKDCPDKTPDKSKSSKSPTELCDGKETVASTVVSSATLVMSSDEGHTSPIKECSKQKTPSKTSNNGLPPPNYIPYRMIAVENTKPVEVIAADSSGDEVSSPKPLPKRRRKYKYVVESVLDNVPYTFRQAESDDDESPEKRNVAANESHE